MKQVYRNNKKKGKQKEQQYSGNSDEI